MTEKQAVSNLKVELARVKEEARLAREAAEKAVATSYDHGVRDTEIRLTEEVATVCRDYITISWGVALDRATVPADSDLRKVKNIFFLEDIHEIPDVVAPDEPLPMKALASDSPMPEAEDAQPAVKDKLPEDSLSIKEVVAQAKEAVLGPQAADGQPGPTQGSDLGK